MHRELLHGHDDNEQMRGVAMPQIVEVWGLSHPHKLFFGHHKVVLWAGRVVWITLVWLRWRCRVCLLLWEERDGLVVNIIPGVVVRERELWRCGGGLLLLLLW